MSFSEPRPSDIPLYSGFRWSVPLDAALWAGESWMPDELSAGKILISSRRTDVTGGEVSDFYSAQMSANGWTLVSADSAVGSMTFTKDTRKAVIWVYGRETPSASSPPATGYRIEILYK
jgi:hypothetical protein